MAPTSQFHSLDTCRPCVQLREVLQRRFAEARSAFQNKFSATATAMRGRMVTALRKKLRRIDKGEPVDDVLAERVEYVAATGTGTHSMVEHTHLTVHYAP